jgi:hypothetical protein
MTEDLNASLQKAWVERHAGNPATVRQLLLSKQLRASMKAGVP